MKTMKKIVALALLLTLGVQLTGCAMTVEEMYCLPRRSESYNNLQTVMDPVMEGLEYAAPSSGSNQQTVQIADLDGDGTGEVIYSIYLVDANTSTMEGLYVGDDLARVTELYGTNYTQNDTELTFTKGTTTLNLILDGETVISIEYRMVV